MIVSPVTINNCPLSGCFIIEQKRFTDNRGYFTEVWKAEVAKKYGMPTQFTRSKLSHNLKAGTLRGLHMQTAPYSEAKLVRCIQGQIFDVLVDVRSQSKTFGQWAGFTLSPDNGESLYIPEGFLHGFITLTDNTSVFYQVTAQYKPEAEKGARFDDPLFNIDWPLKSEPILSIKDKQWTSWAQETFQ